MSPPPRHWQAFMTKSRGSEKPSTIYRGRFTDSGLPLKNYKQRCTPKSTRQTRCRTFWRPSRGSRMRCCSRFSKRRWRVRIQERINVQSVPFPRFPVDGETWRFILPAYGGACVSLRVSRRVCWRCTKPGGREYLISKSGGGKTGEIFSDSTPRSRRCSTRPVVGAAC